MRKNNYLTVTVLVITLLAMTSGLMFYINSIQKKLSDQNEKTLAEIMNQQIYNFDFKLQSDKKTMANFANLISKIDYSPKEIIGILNELAEGSDFEYLDYIEPDGHAVTIDGREMHLSDRDYFKRSMNGEVVISDPLVSRIRNVSIIVVSAPVYKDGKIIAVLTGSYSLENLSNLFLPSFDGAGYAYVTTNSGDIIAKSVNTYSITTEGNLLDDWQKSDFIEFDTLDVIQKNLLAHKGGQATYVLNGNKRYMHYATIEVNGWNLFAVVPQEAIAQFSNTIISYSLSMVLGVGVCALVLVLLHMASYRNSIKEIEKIAFTDELTGAPTLAKFKLEAQGVIDSNPNTKLLIVKFDVDRFKLINQTLGYEMGDTVIKNICKTLSENTAGAYDRYARIHDDEFIMLHQYETLEQSIELRNKFLEIFHRHMGDNFAYHLKLVSGNYYMQLENCTDISEAIEKANIAHRKAKQSGLEVCAYDELMISEALKQKAIENKMVKALDNGEFKVFMQPKYYLSDETLAGAEALVRWKDRGTDVIYPGDFIHLFEENGFITKLDIYMFEKVCEIIKGWIVKGITPVVVSVNFSRRHLENTNLVEMLCEIADRNKVPRHLLEVELTESTIFDNEEILITVLEKLHREGFTLSMDDFGSGYSSLGLLKNIPVDVIKIDRRFFVDSKDDKRAKTVIANVMKMAKELSIHTVAEGVETKDNIELLRSLGCDIVQGYYYSKPMSADDFTNKLIQLKHSNTIRGG